MNDQDLNGQVAVTRSEEQLQVSTRPAAVGRAVLRKTVVIEERTITVQVRHEEAHLEVIRFEEPQPIDEAPGAAHLALPEFVLYREEIAITRTLVPVERVRLHVERIVDQQSATADVRHEQIIVTDSRAAAGDIPDGPSSQP